MGCNVKRGFCFLVIVMLCVACSKDNSESPNQGISGKPTDPCQRKISIPDAQDILSPQQRKQFIAWKHRPIKSCDIESIFGPEQKESDNQEQPKKQPPSCRYSVPHRKMERLVPA